MTASPDLGSWLRQQREQRSWTRTEMARRLIRADQASDDTAMPAAEARWTSPGEGRPGPRRASGPGPTSQSPATAS
jgi:hypothetical protein